MNIIKKIMSFFHKKSKTLPEGNEKIMKTNEKKENFLESIRVAEEVKTKKKNGKIEAICCEGDGTGICKISA